ncbi:unnamed protein product [Natator depressus]
MAPRQLCAVFLGILLLMTHSISGIVGTHNEAGYVNVHQYKNQPNLDFSGGNYQRRTEMFQQEFRNGNVSLKLKRLHVADAGTYICFVKSPTWSHEANTELQMAAVAPVFTDVLGPQGQGIGLACRSTGRFPKPELQWVGNKGQNLVLESKIAMTQDNESLYNVLGHVIVPGGEAPAEIICIVQNGLLKTEQQSAIHLAEKQKVSQKKGCEADALLSLEAQKKELESEQHDQSKRID